VIFKHALRNSLIPLVTGLGNVISLILAGSFLIERVFNIDGMGYLGYTAILQRDYPVALGILVIDSLLMLVGNILSDVIYATSIRASASNERPGPPAALDRARAARPRGVDAPPPVTTAPPPESLLRKRLRKFRG
jgi:hypothetical protein